MLSLTMRVLPPGRVFGGVLKVLEAPMGDGRGIQVTRALRESVAKEFSAGAHSLPGGGSAPWDENVQFGTRVLPDTPLGGPGGSLARAWAGSSVNGFQSVEESASNRVLIGVDHPSAQIHRGGSEAVDRTTTIDLTVKAAAFLRHEYQVDTEAGDEVHIPSRPHATTNPELEKDIVAIFQRAFGAQP